MDLVHNPKNEADKRNHYVVGLRNNGGGLVRRPTCILNPAHRAVDLALNLQLEKYNTSTWVKLTQSHHVPSWYRHPLSECRCSFRLVLSREQVIPLH